MDVRCDKCQARYRIDEARVGPQGLAMRCGKCGNTFRATRETAQPAAEPAPAPPAPSPAPPAPSPAPVAAAAPPTKAAVPVAAPPTKAAVPVAAPPTKAAVAAAAKPAGAPPAPAKPPAPPAAAPRAAPKPSGGGGATVMFSAPTPAAAGVIPAGAAAAPRAAAAPVPPPAAAANARASAPAPKPGPAPAKAAGGGPAGSAVAPLGDEAAGRTMMFNAAAPLKTQPPSRTPAGTVKPLSKPTDAAGATLVFGAAPAAAQPPRTPVKGDQGANATILFGNAAPAIARPPGAQVPTPPPQTPPPPVRAEELAPAADEAGAETASEPIQDDAGAQVEGGAAPEETEAAGQPEPAAQAPAWHGPPRALIIGVAAALGLVLVLGGVVLAVKKLGHRAPPQAAMDALADGHAAAEKDTLASLADAEAQTNAALQAAPKAHFPQAWAQLAEVQIAWSDALNDQAWYWSEQASRALASGDDKKKADAEAKAAALQDAAKARLKTAFEAAAAGNKMDPKSPEVALALADYYRAARSRVNQNRELKRAALLKADEARIAFVQGAELLAQDEGGPRAVEKLKTALAGSPRSARIRFRMAMAYLSMHQDAEARKELLGTLDLSPQHERARMAMELLAPTGAPAPPATGEGKRE